MKSPLKFAGALIAASLLAASSAFASGDDTVVLVTSGQGQFTVTYVNPAQTPTVALSVTGRSLAAPSGSRAAEKEATPQSIRVGQGPTVTYFAPVR
jgi:hypothetical protein